MWATTFKRFGLAALVAETTGAIAILLATWDAETVGLGLLIPVYLIPSVVFYLVASNVAPLAKWSGVFYWLPAIGIAIALIFSFATGIEGRDWVGYIMLVHVVAAITTFAALQFATFGPLRYNIRGIIILTTVAALLFGLWAMLT